MQVTQEINIKEYPFEYFYAIILGIYHKDANWEGFKLGGKHYIYIFTERGKIIGSPIAFILGNVKDKNMIYELYEKIINKAKDINSDEIIICFSDEMLTSSEIESFYSELKRKKRLNYSVFWFISWIIGFLFYNKVIKFKSNNLEISINNICLLFIFIVIYYIYCKILVLI